jgi:DNA-binding response OmpR family regulator
LTQVAESSGGQRVLVVDDVEQMRILIRRALSASGYEVDVAATLAEARGLDPAGYDAVLVDANLGPDRGLDLVDMLRSKDPAAAGRCLLITGGAVDNLDNGIAYLAKPFQIGDLLEAVHGLCRPVNAPVPGPNASSTPEAGGQPAAEPPCTDQPAAGEPQTWRLLLDITRRIRSRERRELTDFLHDGPIQELTAASLELQMLRRSASAGPEPRRDAAQQLVEDAAGSLRWLVDGPWPFTRPETQLETALQQRIGWLLAAPVSMDTGEGPAGPSAIEVPIVVDVVELMLLGMSPTSPLTRAHVVVRAEEQLIQIHLILTAAAGDGHTIGDATAAEESLAELATALRASVRGEFRDRHWQGWIALPRSMRGALQKLWHALQYCPCSAVY